MPTDMFSRYRKERSFQLGSISKLEAVRKDASHTCFIQPKGEAKCN